MSKVTATRRLNNNLITAGLTVIPNEIGVSIEVQPKSGLPACLLLAFHREQDAQAFIDDFEHAPVPKVNALMMRLLLIDFEAKHFASMT